MSLYRVKGLMINEPKTPWSFLGGNRTQYKQKAPFSDLEYASQGA
jgi:hypothetical protein